MSRRSRRHAALARSRAPSDPHRSGPRRRATRSAHLVGALLALGTVLTWCAAPGNAAAQALPPFVLHVEPFTPPGGPALPEGVRVPTGLARAPALAAAIPRTGTARLPVILARFADSPAPPVTQDEIDQALFTGPASSTLSGFYAAASGGRLTVEGTVTPWVDTEMTVLEASGSVDGHGWITPETRTWVAQAVAAADPFIDFRTFDEDGNGLIEIAVQYPDVAGSCGGPAIWPHIGGFPNGALPTQDIASNGEPIRVQLYIAQSAVDCTGATAQVANVIAHEFGHTIGLPDLYAATPGVGREGRYWNVGCFDLMSAGAWGCGTGPQVPRFGPVYFTSFLRDLVGWQPLVTVGLVRDVEYILDPISRDGTGLRIPLDLAGDESLIVEYRDRSGFDAALPDQGILVLHRDENAQLLPPSDPPLTRYHTVEADGDAALRRLEAEGGNRGVAADLFARGGSVARLDNTTVPSTRTHRGVPTTVTLHEMWIADGQAHVVLSTAREARLQDGNAPVVLRQDAGVVARYRIAGGALPYIVGVEGALPPGVTWSATGDHVDLGGTADAPGLWRVAVGILDALGTQVVDSLELIVDPPLVLARIVDALTGTGSLPDGEADHLDLTGNGDGTLDVGDLRAWWQRTGG